MKRILLILLMGLFQNFIFGATISSNGTEVNWNVIISGSVDYFAPSTPTNVRGDNATCSGYIARWNGSATKFYIDVATTNTFASGTIVSAYDNKDLGNVNNVNLTGLNPGTTYYFRLRAWDSTGYSGYSSVESFTTLSVVTPTNIRSDNVNWCTSTIRWDGSATKFYVDVATSNTFSAGTILSAYNNLDVGNVNVLTLSGLLPNTTYYFRVRRLEACGLSGNSSVGSFTTMTISAPTANTGFASCNDWVAQWNGVYNVSGNQVDGYYLDVAIDNTFTNYVSGYQNLYVGNVNSYNITGLARGGVYYYRLRASTSCGIGGYSNIVTFTEKGNNSSTPGTIGGGATSICSGANTTFTISGSNPSNGTWSIFNQTGSATITQGGVVTGVSPGTVLVVFTTYNGCGTSTSKSLTIDGATFTTAPSSSSICANVDVTYTTQSGKSNYVWTIPGTLGNDYTISAGGVTTNSITIKWLTSGSKTVTVNYSSTCSGSPATNTVTVNAIPSAAGTITGTAAVCQGQTSVSYSVPPITNATSYTWSYSGTGATFTNGTTRTPTLTFSSNATSGNLTVYGVSSCGNGTVSADYAITVNNSATATPGTINQPTNKCASTTGNTFSITSVPGATSYTWSVTGTGWAITAGGTTTSATITIGSGVGTVSVTATNACGTSSASTTGNITPNTAPTITAISSPSALCPGGSLNPSAPMVTNNGSAVTASGWEISTTSGGSTYTALSLPYTVAYADNGKNIRYYATNGCGRTDSNVVAITVNPLPGTPTVTGATDVTCSSFLANWTAATNATGYFLDVSTVNNFSSILPDYNGLDIGLVSSYNVTGLTKKTTYFYRLRAYNSCSTSVSSNYIQIKTLDVPTAVISGTTNVCKNAASPIITFSNSENSPITVTYNINGGSNSTISVGANTTATVSVPTGNPGTFVYNLVSAAYQSVTGCLTSLSGAATVTVNPTPTPTFTTAPQVQTCAGEHMTYTTQSGQSNYTWTVSGVLNTDYRLIARGTSTNYDIVIEWLTAGSKTVTVNYTNSNGCNGTAAATYITNVTVIDRGRVNGGAHICKGSPLPTLTLRNDAGNAVYPDASLVLIWQYSDDLNNATWNDIPGTAGQISYTPTAFPGAFRTYQVILKSGICTKTSIESRINIDAFNAPTLGTTTYPTCSVATGSVVLTGLPSGNWTINQTGTTTATYTNIVANTTSYTVVGLPAGTYTFTVKEGNCTSDASAILNMTQVANIWDGTKWSKTGDTTLPTAGDKIVFEGDYTVTSDISGCSCTVNSGNVIVNSGRTLTIKNEVTVNGGTLTFENNASLLQDVNTTVNNNSGPIIYKRNSQPMKNFDFTYWSSPVEGQTLYNLSPNTLWDKYQSYSGSGWKIETSTNVMQPGIGYIIRVPKPFAWPDPNAASYIQPVQFIGKPNNGNITSSQHMDKGKYYLIGNPYPSAIHADDFLFSNVNNRNILGGTIYFWTHNTAIKVVNSKLAYVSDDYASYNLTGGVATSAVSDPGYNDNPSLDTGRKPTGYIAAGQSFFTMAEDGSGYVEFNNSMRYGGTDNSQFFKPGKTSKSASIEKHRLWLNLTNTGGAFKQTLIGYVDGATNGYDTNFDGMTYDGNSYIDFYSVNETSRLTIQGRALPFSDSDVVPLGYRSTIAGDFTIAIDQADGSLSTQRIYLEDKQTGTINELTAKNYTFTTKAGAFNNRFVLRYKNTTLGTGDFETVDDAVWVVAQNKTITVNSTAENIDKVFIYDVSGKELYSKDKVGNLELILQNQPFAQQVLLVKVVLGNGYQTTKKVIFK